MMRKHVDAVELDPFFHSHQKDGKVYVISNDKNHCGVVHVVNRFQEFISSNNQKKNGVRTSMDGLRLACILLDPKYRGTVSGMMAKKRDRKKSDQTGDPVLHFYELIRDECFLNKSYKAMRPSDEDLNGFPIEKEKWDPDSDSIFEHQRSSEWLRATWEDYVRPKYKKSLDKWNKDTGGGDGTPASFHNFCAGDKWLVWLFCVDKDANFLLASNAGGRMPGHLQMEAGFDAIIDEVSEVTEDTDGTTRASKRDENITRVFNIVQQHGKEMAELAQKLSKQDEEDRDVDGVAKYSNMMTDNTLLSTMSPASKEAYVAKISRKRQKLLNKMKAEMKENSSSEDDE